jgi:hypothetical protein
MPRQGGHQDRVLEAVKGNTVSWHLTKPYFANAIQRMK